MMAFEPNTCVWIWALPFPRSVVLPRLVSKDRCLPANMTSSPSVRQRGQLERRGLLFFTIHSLTPWCETMAYVLAHMQRTFRVKGTWANVTVIISKQRRFRCHLLFPEAPLPSALSIVTLFSKSLDKKRKDACQRRSHCDATADRWFERERLRPKSRKMEAFDKERGLNDIRLNYLVFFNVSLIVTVVFRWSHL